MPDAPIVIVNPTAGGGRAGRLVPWLRERLALRPEVRLHITTRRGEAAEVTAAAVADGADRVVAVGGDGTVQEIVNGLCEAGSDASLGIVPVGRGNDLARSLGLARDPGQAWTAAIGRNTRRIDVGHARNGDGRERWFASAGGIGFDAQVAAAMDRRSTWMRGPAAYAVTTIVELRRFSNRRVAMTLDGAEPIERSVLFVAIANGPFYGGGMRIAPDASVDDGLLDLCVVGDISRATAIREMPHLYRGTHVRLEQVELLRARSLTVEGDGRTTAHLDGEPFGGLPLAVQLHPARLEVAAPGDAPK